MAFVCPWLLVQPACPLTLVWLCLGLLVPWVMSCPVCSSAWKCPHSPPWPREGPTSGLWDSSLSRPLPPRRPFGYTFWTVLGSLLSCLVMHRSRGDEELSAFWSRKTSTSSALRKQQGWAFLSLGGTFEIEKGDYPGWATRARVFPRQMHPHPEASFAVHWRGGAGSGLFLQGKMTLLGVCF